MLYPMAADTIPGKANILISNVDSQLGQGYKLLQSLGRWVSEPLLQRNHRPDFAQSNRAFRKPVQGTLAEGEG